MIQVELSVLSALVDNLFRSLMWSLFALLGAVGVCFGCGQLAYLAWAEWMQRSVAPGPFRAEVALRREAARGLAQIEAYLANPGAVGDIGRSPDSAGGD